MSSNIIVKIIFFTFFLTNIYMLFKIYFMINKNNDKKLESNLTEETEIKTDWLTRKQARSYLQCSLSFLDTRIQIKKYYLNKSVRYLKTDLDNYLLSHFKEPIIDRKK